MSGGEQAHFPKTHWTLVARLRSADTKVARPAMEDLISQYRFPLYAYIRRRGLAHCDAEDALHEFLLRLLSAHALEVAQETRGKLRGYLSMALSHFLANWRRGEARRLAVVHEFPPDAHADDEVRYAGEQFSETETPEQIFDRKWCHALMVRVLNRLKSKCVAEGREGVFFTLRPVLLSGGSLRGHDSRALAARLGTSEGGLRVTLNRHLRAYRDMLEEEVRQTLENPADVADEIACLREIIRPSASNCEVRRSTANSSGTS